MFGFSCSHPLRSSNAQASSPVLNKHSKLFTHNAENGGAKAMLYATGMTDEDMTKPQIGISSIWFEGEALVLAEVMGSVG